MKTSDLCSALFKLNLQP